MIATTPQVRVVGRYAIHGEVAAGGMATVHIGRLVGPAGFARIVAIKRMHAQFAADPDFVAMFLDEAWLAARIQHPNVVQTLDVVTTEGELFLVMEYVQGETLARLERSAREAGELPPARVVVGIASSMLHGLHAAHEAKDESGKALSIVHRDVSPQNVMVGVDGIARLLDFGVAKATVRLQTTREGQLKGKLAYMAPEQLAGQATRASDIYSAGVVLWEGLTGHRLFDAETEGSLVHKVLHDTIAAPSAVEPRAPVELDAIVLRALSRNAADRYASAREMAIALEETGLVALPTQVGAWVTSLAEPALAKRAERVAEVESRTQMPRSPSLAHELRGATDGSAVRALERDQTFMTSATRTEMGSASVAVSASSSALRRPLPTGTSFAAPAGTDSGARMAAAKKTKRHILVIDDSEIILTSVKRVLEADGHEVTTTTRTVGNARYIPTCDLVIIDYHMPGLDGGTVISSLRAASPAHAQVLFYLYTSDVALAKDYAKMGFDGCFTDKGNIPALVRQVRAAIRVLQMRALAKK